MSGHESRARMVDEYLLNFGAKDVVPEAEEQSADGCRIGRELACFDLAPCCASRRCRGLRCSGWFAVSWLRDSRSDSTMQANQEIDGWMDGGEHCRP